MVQVNRIFLFYVALSSKLLIIGCEGVEDTYRRKELISSKGEKLYINTLNWGVTDDYQFTIVTKDMNKLKSRSDTLDAIKGLEPFIYKFSGDTLFLYASKEIKIAVQDSFQTIKIICDQVDHSNYMNLTYKAGQGVEGYQLVP